MWGMCRTTGFLRVLTPYLACVDLIQSHPHTYWPTGRSISACVRCFTALVARMNFANLRLKIESKNIIKAAESWIWTTNLWPWWGSRIYTLDHSTTMASNERLFIILPKRCHFCKLYKKSPGKERSPELKSSWHVVSIKKVWGGGVLWTQWTQCQFATIWSYWRHGKKFEPIWQKDSESPFIIV